MKKVIFITLFAVGGLFALCTSSTIRQDDLQQIFNNCPEQAKPWTWWHWMNGNVTKKGITSDLEAMKRAGLAGVHIFNISYGTPAGPVTFLSQEWMDLTLFAIEEADRLELQTGMHNCPGWSASGGSWIEPKNAMKKIIFSEYKSEGGKKIEANLPLPPQPDDIADDTPNQVHHFILPRQDFYEDIKVLAFPSLKDDGFRFSSWKEKTGSVMRVNVSLPPIADMDIENRIGFEAIVDISQYMDTSGRLTWDAPKGNWTIVRFGYTYLNRSSQPAPVEGAGLECDKFDTVAVKTHFDAYSRKIIEMARPYAGKSFNVIAIDSHEAGIQTWSANFMQEFAKRRGYDMTPWLPCLTGRIVGSPELTDRFLCDYRLTVSDLYRDHYYGYMRQLVNQYGMKLFVEPYGNHNINQMDIGSQADVVATEFWKGSRRNISRSIRTVSSVAHVYDKKIVDAESFSSDYNSVWSTAPVDIKPFANWAYVQGINRFTLHSYPHQPRPDIKPGMSMGPWGTFFSNSNTWWEPGKAMFRYFTRCNAMLQQGVYVADILNYTGDVAPWKTDMDKDDFQNLNFYNGYSFDYCNTDVILNRISIKNGKIALPGGITYSLLLLDKNNSMNPDVLQKIRSLVKEGMILVGERPEIAQGLKGYPGSDEQVKSIASELWGDSNAPSGVNFYGKGKVFWGKNVEEVLQELAIVPDFVCKADDSEVDVHVIHRRTEDADIYFLANLNDKAGRADVFFRVKGKQPELWDPDTGEMKTPAVYSRSKDGVTVPLYFDSNGSMFIVFRKSDKGFDPVVDITLNGKSITAQGILLDTDVYVDEDGKLKIDAFEAGDYVVTKSSGAKQQFVVGQTNHTIDISDHWDVWFDPAMGGEGDVMFEKPESWNINANPEIKYYSGTALYKKDFGVPETMIGGRIYLSFDRIADVGRVVVNGVECAILWTPPYRTDITKYVKAGHNTIEVGVTNTWNNRLVGDERYPDDHKFFDVGVIVPNFKGVFALKEIPDWYTNGQPKPDNKRVAFVTVKSRTMNSPIYDAGIMGEVKIIAQLKNIHTNQ